ncbi:aldehyde dehydrogenase family protein [Aeromicrobium senzhongii]|uniref:Aldehyde dehydrogenase family protein n=1 Tax=Aeromicrobium senzhongii TaxID=2663859 RepID=A0ABX6SRR5_9ACTN|nr:aldehyde dehydrogenase family protein [Aeromicrobium senzhongii]MTB88769.1 aldehyde dehydrogenase family protein [Aeromicrobium senzhongii]QNL93937.1 aldehyde dehydrogenase family protein [Aeromicrobium senzhongii]
MSDRLDVRKTYKLFIGGAFPRSESGRTYEVTSSDGRFLANASKASRKDGRDAVSAARKAFGGWSKRTPYNRGQILYRVAEVLEGRRDQLVAEVRAAEGVSEKQAHTIVDTAVDTWVWYAGWADKLSQVTGNANQVNGPFFNLTSPEPTGVVVIAAPQQSSLLGLAEVLAPVLLSGNTAVVISSFERPLPAITLSEILSTSDVPGGVVNILTGDIAEIGPWLAAHLDVNALDLTGVDDAEVARDLEAEAAINLKRVLRPGTPTEQSLARITPFLEHKTVWHPIGV